MDHKYLERVKLLTVWKVAFLSFNLHCLRTSSLDSSDWNFPWFFENAGIITSPLHPSNPDCKKMVFFFKWSASSRANYPLAHLLFFLLQKDSFSCKNTIASIIHSESSLTVSLVFLLAKRWFSFLRQKSNLHHSERILQWFFKNGSIIVSPFHFHWSNSDFIFCLSF